MKFKKTRKIKLGSLYIGGGEPISIQSMTNTKTIDLKKTLAQVMDLSDAGCQIVRISVPDSASLNSFLEIKSKVNLPLVADVHFDAALALDCIERGCDGIRINPGNISSKDMLEKIVLAAKKRQACIRIGVNSGSLEQELLDKYGQASDCALAESCLNWASFFEKLEFYNFKLSVKSSDPDVLVRANKMLSSKTNAPIHLGLTESGSLVSGLVKSSIAISRVLEEGIGDTIRISLSCDPLREVVAASSILKTLGLRNGLDIISCPTCSRTGIDVISIAEKLEREFSCLAQNMKIAVMGCVVNGPGEARHADAGIAGAKDSAVFFVNGKVIKKVAFEQAYEELRSYILERTKGG